MLDHDPLTTLPELRDVVVHVEAIPGTQLVHLAVGDGAGLVLTRAEGARLGRELITVSGLRSSRGRAAAGGGRTAMGRSAARTS